jgi:hypothetical protein
LACKWNAGTSVGPSSTIAVSGVVWRLLYRAGTRKVGLCLIQMVNTKAKDVFDRDCCMLLDNLFFAQGEGVQVDAEAIAILKSAQPNVRGNDDYAVFGVDALGQANGLRGWFLEIGGKTADQFVAWLTDRAGRVAAHRAADSQTSAKGTCRPGARRRKHGVC